MAAPKSNGKVSGLSINRYAQWRNQAFAAGALQDARADAPSERLLQQIWHHQRLCRDALRTIDDRPVQVLHPGFWNHEAGPDFRNAVVQFANEPPHAGDVEIDLRPSGWHGHGHDRNPAYRNVILHVVWDTESTNRCALPTLALKPRLDAPLAELIRWLGHEAGEPVPTPGNCSGPLRDLPSEQLAELLRQAATVRLQRKAADFAARARQVGWEQSLWEGLFAALGYKHNVWPMRRIAELIPRFDRCDAEEDASALLWQARLLGVSGLIPAELTRVRSATDRYLRRIWDHWWREREKFVQATLPRAIWRLHGLRPANHPQRRLALAAHWLAAGDLPQRIEDWFTKKLADAKLQDALLKLLQADDEFWSWHWTLRSARMNRPQPLLGAARVTDFAVNVILPWCWTRAHAAGNDALRRTAEARYFAWPTGEDNAVLRLVRQRLLGGGRSRALGFAAMQQGLLQISRDFCDHSNALCEQCRFPELVRSWSPET